MNSSTEASALYAGESGESAQHSLPLQALRGLDRRLRAQLLKQIGHLRECEVVLEDAEGSVRLGTAVEGRETLRCRMRVSDPAFYRMAAAQGSVGAGESYMDGHWSCDDLVALIRILVINRDLLDAMEGGLARFGGWALRAWHALQRNTRSGSRRNIAAHYDLGNDLFMLFLCENMMYSSAVFADPSEPLELASTRKLDRICRKLDLQPGEHVVEIGTGWGGFAIHAARHYGVRVTTTTLSKEQRELALTRIQQAGLSGKIEVLLSDYRDLQGRYDKLVSIEMIEAIGHQYLDTYFGKVRSLLKDDGMALIQAITIEDHRYAQALRAVDFIKRFIFPGSFIPSIHAMQGAIARSSDLKLYNLEDIGPSYALTLRHWRQRFMARLSEVRALGYPERFIRMWEFYLCYCEGGFIERSIGDVQLLLTAPRCRRTEYLPDLRS
ncbi:class I SAM-dependent methyltransferase [Aquimonas sp.]|jgi:cyclopropane-fatty-acyl-phospholipid synthase|uniref:class I SAM-dependent methyltransferase n=1 Tax=Aquimonas sp. TaxID=1872588 RepID=UPI0037BF84D5